MENGTRTLICPVCTGQFTTRKTIQKYCSLACQVTNNRAEHRAKREAARVPIRTCPACGAEFTRRSNQKFCSIRCGQRIQTRRRLGIADPDLAAKCWWCHAGFSLLDGRRLYCSTECAKFVKSLWNLSRYGITRDDFREAWYRQDGKCAICRQPERTARNHLLSIDHDHVTGQFRGLLCSHCNRATGLFGDDPDVIDAAARYVRETRKADHG